MDKEVVKDRIERLKGPPAGHPEHHMSKRLETEFRR